VAAARGRLQASKAANQAEAVKKQSAVAGARAKKKEALGMP